MFSKIFYPTDISDRSERDLAWVAENLLEPSGEIVVAHRIGTEIGTDTPEMVSRIQDTLDEFCEKAMPQGFRFKAVAEAGAYGQVLSSIAFREKCTVAVITVSPKASVVPIVQSLAIPQLILRWSTPPTVPGDILNSVAVATDLEAGRTKQITESLRSLLEKTGRKPNITLIHGVPMTDSSSAHLLFNQASEAMDVVRGEVESWNGWAQSRIVGGQTETELPKLVAELKTSLLVIGLPKTGDIWQLLLGNTAEALVDRTACPVLIVPTD